jgi:hypothetical protein
MGSFPTISFVQASNRGSKPVPSFGDIDEAPSICMGGSGIFG